MIRLCLSLPASLLLQLLYHGLAGLHSGGLRQGLSPHQLLASLRLPPLHGSQPAAAATARRRVVLAIEHAGGTDMGAELARDLTLCVATVLMFVNSPAHFLAGVGGGG